MTPTPGESSPQAATAACTRLARLAAAAALLGFALLSLLPLCPPAVPATPAADAFSTERALQHVGALATVPRPLGSAQHDRARAYLEGQLTALGVPWEVQETVLEEPRDGDSADLYRLRNVVARLRGSGGGPALLLMAHYDSVPSGPGAADDASGVAVLLETLRLLAAGPPLARDVIFLFTDGEELGLLGSRAFVAEHPALADVGLVMNFEARGVRGPSILFETGDDSLLRMRQVAAVAPYPLASSFSYDVYRLLPNDTDFSAFRAAGLGGYNFAFMEGVTGYHTRLDDVDRLDRRSVYHHGTYAVALARHLGNLDLTTLDGDGEAVYFNLPALGLVVYPTSWALPLAVLLLLAAVVCVVLAVRRGVTVKRLLAGVVVLPLGLVAAILAATVVNFLARLAGLSATRLEGSGLYLAAIVALAAVAAWAVARLFARRVGVLALTVGGTLTWSVLGLGAALLLPSTSYLFAVPLLFFVAALVGLLLAGGRGAASRTLDCALLTAAALPTLLVWVPTVVLVGIALGVGSAALVAAVAAFPLALCAPQALLLAGVGSDAEAGAEAPRPWPVVTVTAAVALVLLVAAVVGAGYGPDRPRLDSLFYLLDDARGDALWVSFDAAADAWTGQVLGVSGERREVADVLEGAPRNLLAAEAPHLDLAPPSVDLLADEALENGGRRLRFQVASPRGAGILRLALRSDSALPRLTVAGREVTVEESADGARSVVFWALPAEGVEVEVESAGATPLHVTAVDIAQGLPAAAGLKPRGPDFAPHNQAPTDVSLVRSVHEL